MEPLILRLNGEEVLLFCNRIKNSDVDFATGTPIAGNLLLKLFSIFNELVTDQGFDVQEKPVCLIEKELWLLRSYVSSSDRISDRNPLLGLRLMRKIHALLLQANCDFRFDELEKEFVKWSKQQPRKERTDASGKSDQDNTQNNPGDQAPKEIGTGENLPGPEAKSSQEN